MKGSTDTLVRYMTDLHLVTWHRPQMTDLVIKTIERNTKPGTYNLMVWDNTPANIGLEAARQNLLLETQSEYFVCIDNDCLPPPVKDNQDWLERLIELMEKYEDFGAISMRTQVMIGSGNIFEEADEAGDDIVEFPHPGGSFRIMRTDLVKEIGGWDRAAPGRGSEETFICAKLHDAGYRTAFATNIRCLHLFGLRGENPIHHYDTDRWGYDKDWAPQESGHNDISHPALTQGDDKEEISLFSGEELANDYCNYQK